jgi:hypothetical protein
MNPELDTSLCQRYPKIFKNRDGSVIDTCMAWGFECDSGWFDIIDILCHEIQHYLDWKCKDLPEDERDVMQVVADQVKEKFGTLRFYYHGGDEVVEGMVMMAESLTYRTCEGCGCPGEKRGGAWIKTLCDKCHEERKTANGIIRSVV